VWTIRSQIVTTIAARLCEEGWLRPCATAPEQQAAARATDSSEAYQSYVIGRHYWATPTSTADTYRKSLEYYDRAIRIDPKYARAYLGIADTYISLGWEGWIPPEEMRRSVENALARATALDPNLPEVHYPRANLCLFANRWDDAEREYQAGIRAGPSFIELRRFYALILLSQGRRGEALTVLEDARRLDPRGLGTNLALGTTYYWMRDLDRALDQLKKTVALDSRSAAVREVLADIYESKGLHDLALHEREVALELIPDHESAEQLRRDFGSVGYQAATKRFYQRQLEAAAALSLTTYVSPMHFAMLHIRLGHVSEAFHWLDLAAAEGAPWLLHLRVDPAFDPIRSDPRFTELVRRVGFPERQAPQSSMVPVLPPSDQTRNVKGTDPNRIRSPS
jgi:tetratricopeptide (TPR) repeat protein